MTAASIELRTLPADWQVESGTGWFRAVGVASSEPLRARVRAFAPLERNPDYLLDRVGARRDGPLGRPQTTPLPRELADGIAVLAFEPDRDDTIVARIELVRRAWDLDVLVSARTTQLDSVESLATAMVGLLAAVHPSTAQPKEKQ